MFSLYEKEVAYLVLQNAIPSEQSLGERLPWVFTEQGVASVSGDMKSEKADKIRVSIARTFVAMRKSFYQALFDTMKRMIDHPRIG